jgi:hypothetical protein
VSSPPPPQKSSNPIKTIKIIVSSSWHGSFPPKRIIKAVVNKQTRPTSRAFAFNTSHALSACLTCIF